VKVDKRIARSSASAAAKGLTTLVVSAALMLGGIAAAPQALAAPVGAASQAAQVRTARWARTHARLKARSASLATRRMSRYMASLAPKPVAPAVPSPAPVAPAVVPWHRATVSWYGPGFYGHGMAGGGTLRPNSMVVAHRSLPFGTRIEFAYGGRRVIAVVRDRGPFIAGRLFDLGPGTAKAIGFDRVGVGRVQYRILH
jgi:rare lipoprotein A (peptidoglycan hydrolase)